MGLDAGLKDAGMSICEVEGGKLTQVLAIRHVLTVEKNERYASESMLARAGEHFDVMREYIDDWNPRVIFCESESFPQNMRSAIMIAHWWGVLASIRRLYRLPVIHSSPQDIKARASASRKKTASKADLQAGAQEVVPGATALFEEAGRNNADSAHPWDSIGAVIAGLESDAWFAMSEAAALVT